MALSDTNMRLNPKSLVLMNYTIVTSVKNSSWKVPGSLRWKLVVLSGFGRSPDFRAKSEISPGSQNFSQNPCQFSPASQILAKTPANFPRASQIAAKIPANFPRPAKISAKTAKWARNIFYFSIFSAHK